MTPVEFMALWNRADRLRAEADHNVGVRPSDAAALEDLTDQYEIAHNAGDTEKCTVLEERLVQAAVYFGRLADAFTSERRQFGPIN